eukprot:6185810-Pleurochrysis_carterae.AAC.6
MRQGGRIWDGSGQARWPMPRAGVGDRTSGPTHPDGHETRGVVLLPARAAQAHHCLGSRKQHWSELCLRQGTYAGSRPLLAAPHTKSISTCCIQMSSYVNVKRFLKLLAWVSARTAKTLRSHRQ